MWEIKKRAEQREREEVAKEERGGQRKLNTMDTDATKKRKMEDLELSEGTSSSEEEGSIDSDLAPASPQKKPKRNTSDEPDLTAGNVGPGKGMRLVFRPNIVVRGKPTIPAGSDGRPRCYWQKVSKTPLQKVAARTEA
jgi:hypothetical protein